MGIDINGWMDTFTAAVLDEFGGEVRFIGLQGSYGRGEATDKSDIDVVVIFEEFTAEHAKRYRSTIANLPERDKLCGFVSGWGELSNWDKSDLFQFCYDTAPFFGNLNELRDSITMADARRSVLTAACAIYHACCHNLLHERSRDILSGLCKGAFFLLRAKHYCETGAFIARKSELAPLLSTNDRDILGISAENELCEASSKLLGWSGRLIREYGA